MHITLPIILFSFIALSLTFHVTYADEWDDLLGGVPIINFETKSKKDTFEDEKNLESTLHLPLPLPAVEEETNFLEKGIEALSKEQFQEAETYLAKSINQEVNDIQKANFYLGKLKLLNKNDDFIQAWQYFKKAPRFSKKPEVIQLKQDLLTIKKLLQTQDYIPLHTNKELIYLVKKGLHKLLTSNPQINLVDLNSPKETIKIISNFNFAEKIVQKEVRNNKKLETIKNLTKISVCPRITSELSKSIIDFNKKANAGISCGKQINTSNSEFIVFTLLGPCFDSKSSSGSCGNNYLSYLAGTINKKLIHPIKIGGKNQFNPEKLYLIGNTILIKGLAFSPNDAACCPSIKQTKKYTIEDGSFTQFIDTPEFVRIPKKDQPLGLHWVLIIFIAIIIIHYIFKKAYGQKTSNLVETSNAYSSKELQYKEALGPFKYNTTTNPTKRNDITWNNKKENLSIVDAKKKLLKFKISYFYHMTHINNIDRIFTHGLLPHGNRYVVQNIDNQSVNNRRNRIEPIHSMNLHRYVPFYFNPKNPMLYVQKEQQQKIVILGFSKSLIFSHNAIFTDGNAAVRSTKFFSNIDQLSELNWKCINSSYWSGFDDGKRERMAEILIPKQVDIHKLETIFCYNQSTAKLVQELINKNGFYRIKVKIDRDKYF